MKGTLWTKLALSYVAIALTAVALSAFLFNFFLSKKFQGYVEETQRIKDEQMVILLGSIYENDGKWDPARIQDVLNMGMMSGKKITILDSEGRRVTDCCASTRKMGLDAQKKISGMMKMCGWDSEQLQLKPIQATSENWPFTTPAPDLPELKGREVPVFVGKRQVGTAVINPLGNRGAFSVQDRSFQKTVNRWLWGAALGAGGFALIMSLGMARRLSRPLRALSRAAQQLKDGDLTQQVEPEGKDEIGQLGRVFNHLAKSLQRQEQFRRKLTSDLAHELRTPLTNLQTHIEALLDGVLTPTQENLSSIHEEILRLGRLVSSLEKLTRAEAGVLNLKREHRDLRELVEKMTCQFQPLFIDKGVKLTISLPRGPVDISLDADKISQVIGNLLSNALKFTPQGGEVEVAARKGDREVRISVKDSGAGIPERDIPFIFERFFRGEDGNGGGSNGSGIGLTIVRELTEAHGGKIDVKSQRNRGAEFTIRLPLPL